MEHNDQIKLWARLGVTLSLTPEELALLTGPDTSKAKNTLLGIIRSYNCQLEGETYIPITDQNEKVIGSNELEYYISPTPLQRPANDRFEIDTPHGTLEVYNKDDDEYPGVWIDLQQPSGQNVTLAMVEYIPGGEGIADYNPYTPKEMQRQEAEVPPSRREGESVSPGFVTRSWPDEIHDEDNHHRTFHTGYAITHSTDRSLDAKIRDADSRNASPISDQTFDRDKESR